MDSDLLSASEYLRAVEGEGLWAELINTMALDIQDQLDMMNSDADRAVFWSLTTKAIQEKAESDTAINILEYLLGVTDLADYIGDFMREYHGDDRVDTEA